MADAKDIQAKEKTELSQTAEHTIPGPVFSPDVDIFENEKSIVLLADIPGVKAEDLDIDLRDNTLTIIGKVASDSAGDSEELITEYRSGNYLRRFTLSEEIDQEKIVAKLDNGVLRLTLPKAEKAVPRRIAVNAA